jgi:hypothetical protein
VVPGPVSLTIEILTPCVGSVVLAIVAIVVMYPNIASLGIEERGFTVAIRELDAAPVSCRLGSRGLKVWFQRDHRKKQKDEREDGLRVKVNTHVRASQSEFSFSS